MTLPPFPTDAQTLDLLESAITGTSGPDGRSSVGDLCVLYSELAGADTAAVESEDDGVVFLRDPQYSTHDVITALVDEVRRLRRSAG